MAKLDTSTPYVRYTDGEWLLQISSHETLERMAGEATDRSMLADRDEGFRVAAVLDGATVSGISTVSFPAPMTDMWRLENDTSADVVRLVIRDGEGVEDRAQFPGLVVRRCAQSRAVMSVEVLSPCR